MKATKPRTLAALIALILITLLFAQPRSFLRAQSTGPFEQIIGQVPPGRLSVGLAARQGTIAVVAELADAPLLVTPNIVADPVMRQSRLAEIKHAQDHVRSHFADLQAHELYSTRLVYNGIALELPVSQLPQLRSLPGIRDIHVLAAKQLTTIQSVPYVEAPQVWGSNSATGRGTRIGIIDSGIDYTHAAFGGTGNPQDFAANNPAIIESGSFPTAKVAGGYDFAGNSYDADDAPFPSDDDGDGQPGDPDPLDCNGHGTLVAGAAAGSGVAADGKPYRGPYTSDLDLNGFRIGPGVAPEATLYALKVLGCTASADAKTTLLTPAIEWAIDPDGNGDPSDHLDVLVIALGSPFGGPNDADALAANAASAAGVVVVAAAGNTGGTFYSINSPASAASAIAVTPLYDTRTGAPGQPDSLLSDSARGPLRGRLTTKPDIAAPGYAIQSAAISTGSGFASASGSSMATPFVGGAAALLRQLHPTWTPAQIKAALLNTATPIQDDLGKPYPPTYGGAGRLNIAAAANTELLAYADDSLGGVGVDYGSQWAGDQFLEYHSIRIDNMSDTAQPIAVGSFPAASEPDVAIRPADVSLTVPPNSSRVVRVRGQIFDNDLDLSPDPTVPLSQNNFQRFYLAEHSGSIYIVAGSNSRIRIANGSAEPAIDVYLDKNRIASNLQYGQVSDYVTRDPGAYTLTYYRSGTDTTANMHDRDALGERTLNIGAGTDVTMIASSVLSETDQLRTWTLNEAAVQGAAKLGRVRVVNNNPSNAASLQSRLDVYLDGRRVAAALTPRQVGPFMVLLPGVHSVAFYAAGALPALVAPLASSTFTIEAGSLLTLAAAPLTTGARVTIITSQPRTVIRVPYALTPHPLSESVVTPSAVQLPTSTSIVSLTVRNPSAPTPSLVNGLRPLLGAFELTYRSATPQLGNSVDAARLRYTGIATDYNLVGQDVLASQVFFAIAAQGSWATPHEVEYQIFIDSNLDGTDDRVLVNTDLGTLLGKPTANDAFITALCDLKPLPVVPDCAHASNLLEVSYINSFNPPTTAQPDLTPFDRSTLFMRVTAQALGLVPGASQFRYHIETRHRDQSSFAEIVDRTPELTYDISQPAIDTANPNLRFLRTSVYSAFDGASFAVRLNPALLATQADPQILVFHFDNQADQQTQLIPVQREAVAP